MCDAPHAEHHSPAEQAVAAVAEVEVIGEVPVLGAVLGEFVSRK
jgi:hypothetical protein